MSAAEIGYSILSDLTGIENQTIFHAVSYIQSWLRALKNNVMMVVNAAGYAQRAVDNIVRKQGT